MAQSVLSPEEREASRHWLKHVPKPPERPAGVKWHVFISYRSVNRRWALALYDTLIEAGYDVFLDQYELAAGVELEETLSSHLEKSASAVLVWTDKASESKWVKAELKKIQHLASKRDWFHYVIAKVDEAELPFLEQDTLFVDFKGHPDGPRGGELLRLMYGLAGKALSREAVAAVAELDEETASTLTDIKAARAQGDGDALVRIGKQVTPVLVATPLPICEAADGLVALKRFDAAAEVLEIARRRFPSAIRPVQLLGLVYRRQGQFEKAANEYFAKLYAAGHRDPETMGMYAAACWGIFETTRERALGERSQLLYAEAFKLVPTDSYVGVNAASKAVLLGNLAEGRALATKVLPLVESSSDGDDYWGTVTHAEVRLLAGEPEHAARLYRAATVHHSKEHSSLDTTRRQLSSLMEALALPDASRVALLAALEP